MSERYVYIDESGDLGKKSKYFVITAIWIQKPELLDRLIKNLRRHKFRKHLKKAQELRASKSSSELKEYVLRKLSQIDELRCHSVILDKSKITSDYLKNNKHRLYNFVCGALASSLSIDSKNLVIRVDKSKGKQALQEDFNQYVSKKLKEVVWNRKIEVHHSWSHSWSGLQMADYVSWAVFRKLESQEDAYFKIIEEKVNISHVWKAENS
ncbi:DUF3800 domain-containing protein [Candidatus Woesearchaeota archaeon]|nr:DUF3800 domain-containing protein [Candidatus Woesearchaeota archaeon]